MDGRSPAAPAAQYSTEDVMVARAAPERGPSERPQVVQTANVRFLPGAVDGFTEVTDIESGWRALASRSQSGHRAITPTPSVAAEPAAHQSTAISSSPATTAETPARTFSQLPWHRPTLVAWDSRYPAT